MIQRIYIVHKPCVIEEKFFGVGHIYEPSSYMSRKALAELIKYGFLVEKEVVRADLKESILKELEQLLTELQYFYNGAVPLSGINFVVSKNRIAHVREMIEKAEIRW